MRTESRKLERLFDMYLALLRDGAVSRKRMIDDYAINERTLLRDINELSDIIGAEIGYDRTRMQYTLDAADREAVKKRISFTDSDAHIMSGFLRELWDKIDIFVDDPLPAPVKEYSEFRSCITMTLPPVTDLPVNRAEARRLLGLVQSLSDIRFSYFKRSADERYTVNAVPYLLHFAQGRWYLVAKDVKDNITKKYLLEKISDLTSQSLLVSRSDCDDRAAEREALKRTVRTKGNIFFDTDHVPETVRIRFDASVAHHIEHADYGFSQHIAAPRNSDGSMEAEYQFSSFMELWFFLIPWLGECSIVSPEHYRTEFASRVRAALAKLEA